MEYMRKSDKVAEAIAITMVIGGTAIVAILVLALMIRLFIMKCLSI
jgi:hypothetical protein